MDLQKFFKTYGSGLKDITIKNYSSRLNTIYKGIGRKGNIRSLNFLLLDQKDVIYFIDTTYTNLESKSSYFSVAYVALDFLLKKGNNIKKIVKAKDEYYRLAMEIRKELNCQVKKNIPTKKQADNYIEYEKLIEYAKNITNPMFKVIALFHLHYPIRNELRTLRVITYAKWGKIAKSLQKDNNWLIVYKDGRYVMVLNNYKTDKVYGEKVIDIQNNDVKDALTKYLEDRDIEDEPYLLYGTKGGILQSHNYSKYVAKAFAGTGKTKITSTILRHLVISHHCDNMGDDLKKDADIACHSVSTHLNYIKKYK